MAVNIGMFAMTSRLGLVGREPSAVIPLWPSKSRVAHLPELVFSLSILKDIRNILGYIKREKKKEIWPILGHISLPDHITRIKIYWQIQKKWKVKLKITAKTCIKLYLRLALVLQTSGPIPRVLDCGLTSHFGDYWQWMLIVEGSTVFVFLQIDKCHYVSLVIYFVMISLVAYFSIRSLSNIRDGYDKPNRRRLFLFTCWHLWLLAKQDTLASVFRCPVMSNMAFLCLLPLYTGSHFPLTAFAFVFWSWKEYENMLQIYLFYYMTRDFYIYVYTILIRM